MTEDTSHQVGEPEGQYSLLKILGIWAAAALPMGILGWVVAPVLAPDAAEDPLRAAITRVGVLTVGLIWQFILSMIIVRREGGDLRWSTIQRRLWLNKPRSQDRPVTRPVVVVGSAAPDPCRASGNGRERTTG